MTRLRGFGRAFKLWSSLAAAFAMLATLHPAAAAGPTFVSINACTDQLLIALADPEQVLGVTRYARDPARSPVAEQAMRLPAVSGTAEEVLAMRPDIVLAGRFTRRTTREFLRARGFRVVEIDAARSLDEAKKQIAQVARLVGHPDRGDTAIRTIDAAVGRAREAASGRGATVLALQRRGWISGEGSLLSSLLEVVGLRNAAAKLGGALARQISLEQLVALKPDFLLLAEEVRAEDQGTALLHHPALADQYAAAKRLSVPERLVFCGGPPLAEAIDRLASEVEKKVR